MKPETENLESIIRRVQKLLAIAKHERSDPNEAAAAAGMAERIMHKYQLDHAEVIMSALKKGDDLTSENIVCNAKTNGTKSKIVSQWVGMIAVALAKLNEAGCKSGWTPDWEACVVFYGYTADVLLCKWSLNYLVETTNRLCNAFKLTQAYQNGGRPAVNSYRRGVAIGIARSIDDLTRQKQAEVKTSTGTSLILVKATAVAEKYGEMKTRKSNTKVSRGESFSQGVQDGRKVNVSSKPLTGGASALCLN